MAQPTVEEIKGRNPIAGVIGRHVKLTPKNGLLVGLCPFHEEGTPSFVVYENTQSYCCFGCRAGGDVISFVQKMNGISFREAIEVLKNNSMLLEPQKKIQMPPKIYVDADAIFAKLPFPTDRQLQDYLLRWSRFEKCEEVGISPESLRSFDVRMERGTR